VSRRLPRKILTLTTLAIAAGVVPAAHAAQLPPRPHPAAHRAGSLASTPVPGTLNAVAADSPTDAWAVGESPTGTLTLHWNGTKWSNVPSPERGSYLSGVAATSSSNAWAAGTACAPDDCAAQQALIQRWNGTKWSDVTLPSLGAQSSLLSVSATSASDAWATGWTCRTASLCNDFEWQTLILHWNGTVWSRVASPSPHLGREKTEAFLGVSALSPTSAWAVGTTGNGTLIAHWNGTAWSRVASPSPGGAGPALTGVSATSASDVWASGSSCFNPYNGCLSTTLMEHWNGKAWSHVATPAPRGADSDHLAGVAGMSATSAWAVGSSCINFPQCTGQGAILLRWNGTTWTRIQRHGNTPEPDLNAVTALSPTNAWAVGGYGPGNTLILHWNGTSWTQSAS